MGEKFIRVVFTLIIGLGLAAIATLGYIIYLMIQLLQGAL